MPMEGVLGWMVFLNSIKKEDFIYFLINLIKNNQ